MSLENKAALVTGSAVRLGRAIAERLHGEGMSVAIHCNRSTQDAEALAATLNRERPDSATVHACNLHDVEALPGLVNAVAEAHGGLHALVNNASSFYPTAVGSVTVSEWDDLMGTNLRAPFFLSQAAAPWLKQSRGCIVNMADIYGARPLSGHPVYCMAKAGLIMQTESLARELAPEVRVNAIAPGPILHPSNKLSDDGADETPRGTPLERWGQIEEIAAAVLFLARDATFTSGATLPVDGGRRVFGY